MDINNTLMNPDVKRILDKSDLYVNKGFKLIIHTVDLDLDDFTVLSIDIVRDYVNKLADQVFVKVSVSAGTYVHDIYPYMNNMEATLEKRNYQSNNGKPIIKRYKAILPNSTNDEINPDKLTEFSKIDLNQTDIRVITLQLVDRDVEAMSIKRVGGSFKDTTRGELITTVISSEMNKVKVDGVKVLDSIDVDKPNNDSPVKQIVIPSHTPVISIPRLLQTKENGVYSAGIGLYFQRYNQKRTCFVYPLYNPLRFNNNRPRLHIFLIQDLKFSNIDKTFFVDGLITNILCTMSIEDAKTTTVTTRNAHLGFSKVNNSVLNDEPVSITANGPVGTPTVLEDDVIFAKRPDQLDDTVRPDAFVNSMVQMSDIAFKASKRVDFQWNYSDETLLYPGMPVRIFQQVGNKLKKVDGTLLFNHTLYGSESTGLINKSYRSVTHLSAAIKSEHYE